MSLYILKSSKNNFEISVSFPSLESNINIFLHNINLTWMRRENSIRYYTYEKNPNCWRSYRKCAKYKAQTTFRYYPGMNRNLEILMFVTKILSTEKLNEILLLQKYDFTVMNWECTLLAEMRSSVRLSSQIFWAKNFSKMKLLIFIFLKVKLSGNELTLNGEKT